MVDAGHKGAGWSCLFKAWFLMRIAFLSDLVIPLNSRLSCDPRVHPLHQFGPWKCPPKTTECLLVTEAVTGVGWHLYILGGGPNKCLRELTIGELWIYSVLGRMLLYLWGSRQLHTCPRLDMSLIKTLEGPEISLLSDLKGVLVLRLRDVLARGK